MTCTVSINDDGLLSINNGLTVPVSSLTVYVALSNVTVIAIGIICRYVATHTYVSTHIKGL